MLSLQPFFTSLPSTYWSEADRTLDKLGIETARHYRIDTSGELILLLAFHTFGSYSLFTFL